MSNKVIAKEDILYQDNYIIAVDKPHGLMVEPDQHGNPNAVDQVLKLLKHPPKMKGGLGVVYRLDRPVGGVLIFALRPQALKNLQEQMQKGQITKMYTALVEGEIREDSGKWTFRLRKDPAQKKSIQGELNQKDAKEAVTQWKVLERSGSTTLLDIRLKTGRFHQIRAHASIAGYPIVGDDKYGSNTKLMNLNQIALIASSYSFSHPNSGEKMTIASRLSLQV